MGILNNLILFGFKGCGKTYFGTYLAKQIGYSFIDTDQLIEELHGENLSNLEIYKKIGEQEFRKLERLAIASLSGVTTTIIALGGGAILSSENHLEKMGQLVYLETTKETLKKRLFSQHPLPAIFDPSNPEQSFEQLYLEREPIYEKIPARKISLNEKSDQQVIDELIGIIYGK